MGCDIHDYAEVRQGGVWRKVGAVFPYAHFNDARPADVLWCYVPDEGRFVDHYHPGRGEPCNEDCYTPNPRFVDHPFGTRSYATFAVLADVRSHGNLWKPVSKPRGLPGDVTAEVKAASDRWGVDGHSHSWLTLGELLAYDWSQSVTLTGIVSGREYEVFKRQGSPNSWCHDTSAVMVSNDQMDALLAAGDDTRRFYTQVAWTERPADCLVRLWDVTIPALLGLVVPEPLRGEAGAFLAAIRAGNALADDAMADWLIDEGLPPLEDVRMVFWFDN